MIIILKFKNKLIFCEKIHHKQRSNIYTQNTKHHSLTTNKKETTYMKIKTNINTKLNTEKETKLNNDRNTT